MNLQENYKRLFKGKPMSNDACLITEAVSDLKHRYNKDGILVINGKMGGTPFEVVTGGPQGSEKPGISGHTGSWSVYMKDVTRDIMTAIDNDDIKPELTLAIQKYVKQKGLSWQSGKVQSSDDQELELDDPISVTFDRPGRIDAPTEMGQENLPIDSITLHFWGGYINLNAVVDGAMDYYGDDEFLSQLIEMIPKLKSKPDYKEWIQDIESMGGPSANEIEKGLERVEYTESGMNSDGDVSTEYNF